MFCCIKSINALKNHKIRISKLFQNKSIQSSNHVFKQNLSNYKSVIRNRLQIIPKLKRFESKSLTVISGGLITISYIVWYNRSAKCDTNEESIDNNIIDATDLESVAKTIQNQNFDFWKLWSFVRPDSLYLLIAVTSALVVALLNIEIPLSLGSVMNVLSRFATEENSSFWSNQFFKEIKDPALRVFNLYLLQSLFTFVYISSLAIVGEKTSSRIRSQLFSSIIHFDTSFFDSRKSGEIMSRLSNDVQEFKSSFKMVVSQGLRSFTQIIGCSISLFVISPKMTLWMATVIPSMVLCGAFMGSFLRQLSKEAQAQTAKASGVASEAINNVRTVKSFAMEESQCRVYNKELAKSEQLNTNLGIGIGILQAITNLGLNSIVLATLLYGGKLLSNDEISAGNLMSFLVATQTIQKSLSQLSLLFGNYVRGVSAAIRVFEFMDIQPTVVPNEGLKLDKVFGEIEFKNVFFAYPTRKEHLVLNDFHLKLSPGKVTAICGLSGEGKSTVAALLERFYDIDSGSLVLDGHEIRSLDPLWLRGQVIGFINQEPILFGTTVMENIRFGKPDATDEEVIIAAKMANAHDFITSFPQSYRTVVGERGVTVSGGQKQRIAIARALIKDPTILILDEATSALDTESEALVQEALEKVMKNRTVLVIAHRLSTIQNADMIAVVSRGRIAEFGNHSQLIRTKGLYWNLIRQQIDKNSEFLD